MYTVYAINENSVYTFTYYKYNRECIKFRNAHFIKHMVAFAQQKSRTQKRTKTVTNSEEKWYISFHSIWHQITCYAIFLAVEAASPMQHDEIMINISFEHSDNDNNIWHLIFLD